MSLTVDDLVGYFRAGAKPRAQFRIGIEQEKIGIRPSGAPVAYQGPDGIAAILSRLETRGFAATREREHIVALERAGERVTIEPGGQVEFSGLARDSAAACRDALIGHVREVQEVARPLGIRLLGIGARPFGKLDDIEWLPKARYGVMREYFPRHGQSSRLAHHMMKMTATVQANFDYENEADGVEKIRTANGVSSIVTAMYAGSPFADGRPTGDKSFRAAIWLETDEDRCGLLPFVFEPGFGFRDYVEWALDVPMFFVVRDGHYRPADAMPFRRFMTEGWAGETACMRDWELHLSTLFPEVRLKRYIELRGADAGPMPMAEALGALWRGLLDDRDARSAAWEMVAGRPFTERETLRREVPRAALGARFGGHNLKDLALELVRIADAGLARLPGAEDDRPLLAPLWAYVTAGRTPADDLLDDYEAAKGEPTKLVEKWELKP